MSINRRLIVAAMVLVLAGCSDPGVSTDSSQAPPTRSVASSPPASAGASATGSAEASPMPVSLLLPVELNGVELHTFAVGQDIVARLLAELNAAASDLEIAYASDHGARFIQLYALRVSGHDGASLLNAFAAAAYDPAAGAIDRSDEEIGGRAVTVISQPATADRLGTFYASAADDVLFVAQALDRDTAAEGLSALP